MQYALKRYQETGQYTRRPGSGGVRCTSARDDRFIVLEILRNRYLTAVEIRQRLQIVRGVNVSERTVRRRMEEVNLKACRPARGPELLRQHRIARLHFAREHVNWTHEQWARVLFTDECRIALRSPDGRERVWRRRGERFLPITTTQTVSFHGGSIMVWGGISSDARTELVIVDNRLTAVRYIEEVLQEHVMPYSGFIGHDQFLLMHDNARPHVAHCVEEYLEEVGIQKLQWPASISSLLLYMQYRQEDHWMLLSYHDHSLTDTAVRELNEIKKKNADSIYIATEYQHTTTKAETNATTTKGRFGGLGGFVEWRKIGTMSRDKDFMEHIVRETNRYAQQVFDAKTAAGTLKTSSTSVGTHQCRRDMAQASTSGIGLKRKRQLNFNSPSDQNILEIWLDKELQDFNDCDDELVDPDFHLLTEHDTDSEQSEEEEPLRELQNQPEIHTKTSGIREISSQNSSLDNEPKNH
ncbi:hypothetical protein evm_012717 [Chilo suppressalis]|nr:hypothetical protein evm_012717 [Chilo suppressalis]